MSWVRCPTCQKPFDSQATRAMPFCSERCRLIDLGRWLDEDIGIPLSPEDKEDEDDSPLQPDQPSEDS